MYDNERCQSSWRKDVYKRQTLWPFPTDAINKAAESAKVMLAVEMSMGQMVDDVKLAINCKRPVEFFGRTGGVIPTPNEVLDQIKKLAGGLE